MDGPDEALVAGGDPGQDPWEEFQLPFAVTTVPPWNQRAYLRDGKPEWLFTRLHAECKVGIEPWRLWKSPGVQTTFRDLEVALSELVTPGSEINTDWQDRTLLSRGFFAMLFFLTRVRSQKAAVKQRALQMLQGMMLLAVKFHCAVHGAATLWGNVFDGQGVLHTEELVFNDLGICQNWGSLLARSGAGQRLWTKLRRKLWLGQCIVTSLDSASLSDILLFLAYSLAHTKETEKGQAHWLVIGRLVLPPLINAVGGFLDSYAVHLSQKRLEALPALQNRHGRARRGLDPVNRMVFLFKLRREKVHRRRVGKTHEGLIPLDSVWCRREALVDALEHQRLLSATAQGHPHQIVVCWDPSTYGGKNTSVACFWSNHLLRGGYLMNQQIHTMMVSDVSDSLIKQALGRKLTRIEGYNEMRALFAALDKSLGWSAECFLKPDDLLLRPLAADEVRVKGADGLWYFVNTRTGQAQRQVPQQVKLESLPLLVSVSDQGPLNLAALNFLQFSPQALMIQALYDPFHRGWNDLKLALKRASFRGWRAVLELVVFLNVSYGPFGSGTWWYRKRSILESFLRDRSAQSPEWQAFQAEVCRERRQPEPDCAEDEQRLFNSFSELSSFMTKGPYVKLMRWFSIFEACEFWRGEFQCTKLIMEYGLKDGSQVDSEPETKELEAGKKVDDKQQLADLKKRKGTFRLAPSLINGKNMCIKDILLSVGRASWKLHAESARSRVSPDQNAKQVIDMANGGWKDEIMMIVENSFHRPETLEHLTPQWRTHESCLEWHCEFALHLLEARCTSLLAFFTLPPIRYSHVLDPEMSGQVMAQAMREWQALLDAESAALGETVLPLDRVFWSKSPSTRAFFLALEQDFERGTCAAKTLYNVLVRHYGDTRMVENTHQHARDLLRSSKKQTMGNVRIMANTLRSGCLRERQAPVVEPSQGAKVMSRAPQMSQSVSSSLSSRGYQLPVEIQRMLLPKGRKTGLDWPSPTPAQLFQSVAATDFLFKFFGVGDTEEFNGKTCNCSWISGLCQKGSLVLQKSKDVVHMVVAPAQYAALLWRATPRVRASDGRAVWILEPRPDHLAWHFLHDLCDWLALPAKAAMVTPTRGPLGWTQAGPAVPLQWHICQQGVNLTVSQLKDLLGALGHAATGQKAQMQRDLIDLTLPPNLREAAKHKVHDAATKSKHVAEDIDSDFSEVISDLDKEEGNAQDVADLKQKKKLLKRMQKKHVDRDEPLQQQPKQKPKVKAKSSAVLSAAKKRPASSFLQGVLKRARRRPPVPEAPLESLPPEPSRSACAGDSEPASAADVAKVAEEPPHDGSHPPLDVVGTVSVTATEDSQQQQAEVETPATQDAAAAEAPAAPSSSSHAGPRSAAQKVHKTPDWISRELAPPGPSIQLDHNAHRFYAQHRFNKAGKAETYSQAFAAIRSWEEAIRNVHQRLWRLWGEHGKARFPLKRGSDEQTPGQITAVVMAQLESAVRDLPEKRKYGKSHV